MVIEIINYVHAQLLMQARGDVCVRHDLSSNLSL